MSFRDFKSIAPTETLEIENGLSVVPRVKLLLTIYRSDHSVKPIDEWQLKLSLLVLVNEELILTPSHYPREDLEIHSFKDIKKLLEKKSDTDDDEEEEWKKVEGVFGRTRKQQPDTLILRGVPSRWFAETRVSLEPSVIVSHTIFSLRTRKEGEVSISSGLQCKIVVQFEKYDDFCNALKVLCGRSMQKQGSRLKAEYEVSWVKGEVFHNSLQRNGPLQDTVQHCHSCLTQSDSEGLHPNSWSELLPPLQEK
ncbi:hypothetical protein MKW98_031958 [Papaver atlanticum]|uniref:Uncharacterized protein n=1 Tax=Papaver atlanticum TaxID=357466 RepID=A0AAD4SF12_9MAGN|nr:hypothetical protein MKW98_031958 [Papaver atlanticum]